MGIFLQYSKTASSNIKLVLREIRTAVSKEI